ncbi:MAG: TonB-dependent receptor [Bacteroidales bacterium]|nr:TonB-dependent receptor [Bacteroidales bacterium]
MTQIARTILLLLLTAASLAATAQNTVKGVLYDDATGEAIPFANVVLDGTSHGAATDLNGFFIISKVPNGTYLLRIRYVGYQEHTEQITLAKGQSLRLNIKLKPTAAMLNDVVITGNRAEERRMETQVSVEKITASQIQQMPSIGGQADLAQYLQVLPGVNSTGDQGGQLYIRGGSMIQNLTLLDGMIVYNPFHSIGLYSIFETDVILNADVYTGGFGAEYGGRLSSVMDITTRDGNKKRHTGKLTLNTFGAGLIAEGPLKRETADNPTTVTYLLTAKNSYLSKTSTAVYPYIEGGLPFDFLDLYGKLSFNTGTGSKLNLFGFRFDDQVLGYKAIADYHWRNYGVGGNFVLVTGTSSILDGAVAYSDYLVRLDDNSQKDKYSGISSFNATINVTNFFGKNKLKGGISMEGYTTEYHYTNAYGITQEQDEHTTNVSAYASYHIKSGDWIVDPGVRMVYYVSLSEPPSVEPRLAAKWNASDRLRVKLAGGLYSQIILDARSDNDIVNLFSGFLTGSGQLNKPRTFLGDTMNCVQRAQHLVAGMEYDITEHLSANVEGYLKNFSQLLNMNHHQMYDQSDPAYQPGAIYEKPQYYMTDFIFEKGYATGVDVSLCYDVERLYVWGTYSLGYVRRTGPVETYTPHYDRRHTVNLLATYSLGDQKQWELSGRWSFGSGFPYTQTLGVYENVTFSDGIGSDYWNTNGTFGSHYGELYGGRMPNYHRMDLGMKRRFSIGRRSILDLNVSVTNVYNRNNIFYFDRISFERVDQLPIMLSAGINLTF